MKRTGTGAAVALGVLALVVVTGCGSDKKSSSASSSGGSTSSSTSTTASPPPVEEITAGGATPSWSFKLPDKGLTGGVVTLRLKNDSANDTHDFQLVRADSGHTADEVKKIVTSNNDPLPPWLHGAGGVGTVSPGKAGETTMDLPPGHYFYFCTDETDGKPHAANGMFGETDVTGRSTATLAAGTATVTASEYKYVTTGLKAGDNVVDFKNSGKQVHMVLAAPILPGKTIDDVKAAFSSNGPPSGPPPVDFDNVFTFEAIDPGQTIQETWTLKSGRYAFLCFIPDAADGTPHFVKGMLQEVTIP